MNIRTPPVIQYLWSNGRGVLLIVVATGWFFSLGSRMVYPVIFPQLVTEFQVDYGTLGILFSVLMLSYALTGIPGGIIADRLGERFVLVSAMWVAAFGIIFVILAPSFVGFVAATILFGIGCGLFGTTGSTVLSDVYPKHDSTALGVSLAAGSIGTIILPTVAGIVAGIVGWRLGIGYTVPGILLVGFALWTYIPERTSNQVELTDGTWLETVNRMKGVFTGNTFRLVVLVLICVGGIFQGLTGFLPIYLIDVKGFTQWEASLLFGMFFSGSIIGQLTTGPIADRYGKRKALVGFAGVSTPAIIMLPLVNSTEVIVGLVLTAGLISGFTPTAMAYIIQLIPNDIQGGVFGIVRTVFIGVSAIVPPTIGMLADRGQFDTGILLIGSLGILALFITFLLPTTN